MATVLLAETDPHALDFLQRLLLDHLPDVVVDVCSSAADVHRNLKCWAYDTIAISLLLLQEDPFPKNKPDHHVAAPLLVTASWEDHKLASKYLEREAFDLILKPIVLQQAAQSVRLAIWQNTLLRLLASKERTLLKMQEHLQGFPNDLQGNVNLRKQLEQVEETLHRRNRNSSLLSNTAEEQCLYEMAASVAQFTRQRALDQFKNP